MSLDIADIDIATDNWEVIAPPVVKSRTPRAAVTPLAAPAVDIDWDVPQIIAELPPLPKRWREPKYHPNGLRKCDQFFKCNGPYCMECESMKTHVKAVHLQRRMAGKRCLFITLTMAKAGREEGLKEQREEIVKTFKALRDTDTWRENILGGYAGMHFRGEISWGPNVHWHIVAEVGPELIPHEFEGELRKAWVECGGGSEIDVSLVRCPKRASHYVTKGLLRQYQGEDFEEIRDAKAALYRTHKSLSFGTWRGKRKKAVSAVEEEPIAPVVILPADVEEVVSDILTIGITNETAGITNESVAVPVKPRYPDSYDWLLENDSPESPENFICDTYSLGDQEPPPAPDPEFWCLTDRIRLLC